MLNKYSRIGLILIYTIIVCPGARAENQDRSESSKLSYHREISKNNICSIVLNENPGVKIVYSDNLGVTAFRENSNLTIIDRNGRVETVMGKAPDNAGKASLLKMIPSVKEACKIRIE